MGDFLESDGDALYRSLREYSRVEAFLPVRIRRLSKEELGAARSRIVVESALTEHPELPNLEDEKLSTCLQILNAKLDSIIRLLAFPSNSHKELDFELVNISAGGLALKSCEGFEVDDFVEVRLMLPTAPFMIFYVYGNVTRCDAACQKYEVCVEFCEIDDDIREQIAKYVFHRQREVLRKKRSQRS
ncbi:MAG: PilZ domain-containing protein [Syntrophobacteraceae bacterium]